ncbi:DUF4129 domain-containing protein [Microbacterium sp.]|uniref:DUF4129 domain-containing protein n=1 Tax=Microbacterium sp. TaxID=51671 RepID=UPI0037CBA831
MRARDLPLIPDGAEGREWAERELADPRYAAAEPTPLDRLAQAIGEFLESLFGTAAPAGLGPAVLVGLALLAIALIVVAFVIWGRPRLSRQTSVTAPLFGEDDARSSTDLRREASARAAAGDWDAAIVLRYRALARSSIDRGIVAARPGATAQSFARSAARAFPELGGELADAASVFDDVRYLRRPGSPDDYERVAATDGAVEAARPRRDEHAVVTTGRRR